MRNCSFCGVPLDDEIEICPYCKIKASNSSESTKTVYPTANHNYYSSPTLSEEKPAGIVILSIVITLGLFVNLSNFLAYNDSYVPSVKLFTAFFISFQMVAVYGLWNMKTWAPTITIGLYTLNILGNILLSYYFSEVAMTVIIGVIIISYINLSKHLFVN